MAKAKSVVPDALETSKANAAATILQRSVCLLLQCEKLGNSRKVDLRTVEISKDAVVLDGEKKSLRMSKNLIDRKEMRGCVAVIGSAKDYLRSISTSAHSIFGPGTYLVPSLYVKEAETRLTQYQGDLKKRVDELVSRWDAVVEKRRAELGSMFDETQYATADEVRASFDLDWSYVSFRAPDQLEEIDKALAAAADKKYQAKLADAYDEVVVGLRTAAMTVMSELAKKLQPNKDGEPKALQPTALRDLQEFLGRLPILNITDDDPLVKVCAKVGAIASNLDVDVLRKAPGVRDMLLKAAEEAVGELDQLVSTGRRAITFGSLGKKAS